MADRNLTIGVNFKGTDGLSATLRNITGVGGVARDKMRNLKTEIKATEKALKENRAEFQKIGLMGGPIGHLVDKEKSLTNQLKEQNSLLDKQRGKLKNIADARELGTKMRDSGTGHIQRGIAVGAGLIGVAGMGAGFQTQMTDIRLKADLDANSTKNVSHQIKLMARDAMQLPQEMAKGVDTLIGKGLDAKRSTQLMAPIGRAATAYNASIDDLSAASYAALDNLKVPANEMSAALDAMAASGKAGSFELADMAQYFPGLSAQAQAFGERGVSAVADLGAAMQIARKQTGDSASAATNIANVYAKINMKDTIKNFDQMGINLPEAMKKARKEGKTTLEAFAEITNQATKGDTSKLAFLIGDQQAQAGVRALIQNMDEYRKIRNEAMNSGGTIDKDFAIRTQDMAVQGRRALGLFSEIGVNLGTALLPAMMPIIEKIADLTTGFADFAEKNPEVIKYLGVAIATFAGASITLGAFQWTLGALITPWARFSNVLGLFPKNAAKTADGVGKISKGFGLLGKVKWAALATGPLGIAIGIGVAAYLIWKNWDKIVIWGKKLKAWADKSPFKPLIYIFAGVWMLIAGNWEKINLSFRIGLIKFKLGVLRVKLQLIIMKKAWQQALDDIEAIVPGFKSVGNDAMRGLAQGIANGIPGIGAAMGIVTSLMKEKPKKDLQIHSPSRLTREYGRFYSEGFGIGIAANANKPVGAARRLTAAMAAAGLMASPIAAAAKTSNGSGISGTNIQTINIYVTATPSQDTAALAKQIKREFMAEIARANRAKLGD